MQFETVESSNIDAIAFQITDPEMGDGELYVRFKNGSCVRYFQVPRARYKAFMDAESKGGYFSRFIRKKYAGEKFEEKKAKPDDEPEFDSHGMPIEGKVPGVKDKRTDDRTCGRCGVKYPVGDKHVCKLVRTGSIQL